MKIEDGNIVLKHDELTKVTKAFNSIDEHRFLNSCLASNYQRELFDKAKYYPVDVNSYAMKQNISLGKAHTELIAIIKKYMETTIQVKLDDDRTWFTSIIYDFVSDSSIKSITVQFNKKIIPLISGTMEAGKFCMYDSRMDKVPSTRRYLMAELIQRNMWKIEKDGYVVLQVVEIREALNMLEGEYKEYKELNRTVIQPTLRDIVDHLGIQLVGKGNRKEVRFSKLGLGARV